MARKPEKTLNSRKQKSTVRTPSKRRPSVPIVRSGRSGRKDAEEIVQAIRGGRVDALVMAGARGEKVVTLQGSELPYRVLVESINEGAATLDASGVVCYTNTRFAEILEVPVQNLLGTALVDNLPSWQHDKFNQLIARGRRRSAGMELILEAPAGPAKLVRFTLKPLKNTPRHRICVVATELTELVEANEALKTNEESLRQLSARLLQLQDEERRHIARDLHDITGQKLAFQSIALSALQTKQCSNLDAEAQQALSESLLMNKEISEEIRTLSYLLHPPLLDELGLSSAARWYATGFTKRTGIPIDIDVPQEMKRLSPDAEVAIFRVLQESLTNVHRYANTPKARLRIRTTGESIQVEIEDYGNGIHAAKSKSPQESVERLGVGIQGMTERIRQLGGRLEIISGPKRGTLVTATIPISGSQVQAPVSPVVVTSLAGAISADNRNSALGNQRQQILIADDHEMLRRGVRNTLQAQPDLEVCGEAVDGQDAVDKVRALRPDLVILDINMPVLNGLVAVRQILRYSPNTKIVIFSVHDSDQTRQEIRAVGAHGFVSKDKDSRDLLRVVREVLNSRNDQSASAAAAH
jgi:signal transduction histidine kinase/ActR/RegA family two-component response regulator